MKKNSLIEDIRKDKDMELHHTGEFVTVVAACALLCLASSS